MPEQIHEQPTTFLGRTGVDLSRLALGTMMFGRVMFGSVTFGDWGSRDLTLTPARRR